MNEDDIELERDGLFLWTVYDSPADHPGEFVARLFVVFGGESKATRMFVKAPSLDEVRAKLPPGLFRMNRAPTDEPHIVETWL